MDKISTPIKSIVKFVNDTITKAPVNIKKNSAYLSVASRIVSKYLTDMSNHITPTTHNTDVNANAKLSSFIM